MCTRFTSAAYEHAGADADFGGATPAQSFKSCFAPRRDAATVVLVIAPAAHNGVR
jgi:hypothetical protein